MSETNFVSKRKNFQKLELRQNKSPSFAQIQFDYDNLFFVSQYSFLSRKVKKFIFREITNREFNMIELLKNNNYLWST